MGESEKRFSLTLHYDGSAFHGWQIQPLDRTVQGALEDVVTRITGARRAVEGSGRTDAGVHARGQIAAVDMPGSWTAASLQKSLNALLPRDVWVADVSEVPAGFRPRFDAVARTYTYRVGTSPGCMSPFERRWCWPLAEPLESALLDACADQLPGEGSFRAFAKAGQPGRGFDCHIHEASWSPWELGRSFRVTANRYLHHMVRYLVGTMVAVARGHRPLADFQALLGNEAGLETSPPAPAQGLVLEHVRYAAGVSGAAGTGSTRRMLLALCAGLVGTSACTVESIPRTEDELPAIIQQSGEASLRSVDQTRAPLGAETVSDQVQGSRTTAIVRAAQEVAPAVVSIAVIRRQRAARRAFFDDYLLPYRETQGLGSGVIVNAEGTVLTNHHVIEGATQILVTLPDGRDFNADLVGTDPRTDVAVLSINEAEELPAAPLGTASDLLIGEWTVAIGNPFGRLISNSEPTVTAGVVSALGRHILPGGGDEGFYLGMIQTDASINPGNSGGPLVNALGEVIGINSSIFSRSGGSEGLGFAIPIDRAVRVAQDLINHGEVRRAWVGIEVQEIEADAFGRSRGVRVARTSPG
ncbi:MAG: tRNA pseudouridine(38-40) synthase TruA, partial [Gemmatimonadetes bacterium]|nr:tRNA pseudouridine(38-40) synthase TruA [Gemmatimonadota bacterium]